MTRDIDIGYWANPHEQDLPAPIANTARCDQPAVIKKLRAAMDSGYMTSYRGSSTCRLCGKQNGYRELEIIRGDTKYRIPEGYLHYLEDHYVGYDPRLLEAFSDFIFRLSLSA